MTVNLHIDRLVIDGLGVGYRDAAILEAALSAELTRQISGGGTSGLSDSRFEPVLCAAPIAEPAGNAKQLGTEVARAIYEGIRA